MFELPPFITRTDHCKSGNSTGTAVLHHHHHQNRFWSTKRRRTQCSPFKHKHCLLLLFLLLPLLATVCGEVVPPPIRRPLPASSTLPASTPTSPSRGVVVAASRRLHLPASYRPNTEYFYANDKLADDQVASFVSSLQQNGSSSSSSSSSNSQISSSRPLSSSIGVVGGSSGQSGIRSSQFAASSVFPASLVSRASILSAQSSSSSSFSPSYSSSSSPSPSTELSSSKPSSYFLSSSSSSSISTSTSSNEGANNNSSSLPSQGLSNNLPRNSGPQQQQQRNHSTRSSSFSSTSSSRPEFDLSWVQPVYVAKKRTDNDNNGVNGNKISTTTTTSEPKLQLNAFKADPTIDLFPVPSTNRTFNRSILLSGDRSDSTEDESSTELHLEDRLEAFSAALANVTFSLREEQWVAPIIALSLLNIMVILGFECFVIYRACRTCPSRRHLFLGQMLLLGLFLSSVMGIAFVPSSNWLTCTLIRAGLGVCFAIVYGTLLVKAVFLLSLHSGVYLSAEYQALLLFFIISTQVAIDGQWLIHRSSSIVVDYMDGYGHAVYRCDHSVNQLLLSLLYVMILIVLIAIMAFRVRGYRENHGEALFLGITATATILLWLVWIAGTITSTPHYRDGFVAFGLVCNATLIFIIMFLPKGRQLAAVGREGPGGNNHHLDDRDQLSTASSPSIYTPSFLHLKSPVSQLMVPLGGGGKPSIAGLSSVVSGNGGGLSSGTGNGLNGGSHFGGGGGGGGGGYHHLYKQFQGTGTTLTSPMSTTGGPPPTINTSSAIPNSYSSHALFSSAKNNSNSNNHDHEEDPNYSNLSNVFTSIAGNNHLPSPISENNSSSTGVGGGGGSGGVSSQNSKSSSGGGSGSKSGSKSSQNSKSSGGSHSHNSSSHSHSHHMVKSASGTANADGFFYLQPPPLPPPSSRPPAPPGTGNGNNGGGGSGSGAQQQNSRPWRQTCYTPNYHRATSGGVGLSHYGHKSTLTGNGNSGGGGGLYGSSHHHTHHHTNHYPGHHQGADHVRTPMGPPPLPPPTGVPSHHHHSLHHHLLSPSSDNETTSFYFASFDAASSTTRQLLERERGHGNGSGTGGGGGNVSSNFKYFRGPLY